MNVATQRAMLGLLFGFEVNIQTDHSFKRVLTRAFVHASPRFPADGLFGYFPLGGHDCGMHNWVDNVFASHREHFGPLSS